MPYAVAVDIGSAFTDLPAYDADTHRSNERSMTQSVILRRRPKAGLEG